MAENRAGAAQAALTLEEVATLVGGRLAGDGTTRVRGIAPLDAAEPDQLALLSASRYRAAVVDSRAGALLVSRALEAGLPDQRPRVVVDDPHAALIPLLDLLHPQPAVHLGVHPTALLERGVRLGAEIEVGTHVLVGEGAVVGDRVRIGAHSVVGKGCRIGADTILHPQVTLYPGVSVGERVILHAGARIGSDGFGYAFAGGGHRKVPQVGGCVIEDDVEIGANSCIDRGSIGDTVIGHGSKLDNLVHVAHNVCIGPDCLLTALVGIAGSTTVGAGVMFGGQSGVSGHLSIGDGVRVAGKSAVFQDVPAGSTVMGIPASDRGPMLRAFALIPRLPELFRRMLALEGSGRAGKTPRGRRRNRAPGSDQDRGGTG